MVKAAVGKLRVERDRAKEREKKEKKRKRVGTIECRRRLGYCSRRKILIWEGRQNNKERRENQKNI